MLIGRAADFFFTFTRFFRNFLTILTLLEQVSTMPPKPNSPKSARFRLTPHFFFYIWNVDSTFRNVEFFKTRNVEFYISNVEKKRYGVNHPISWVILSETVFLFDIFYLLDFGKVKFLPFKMPKGKNSRIVVWKYVI